MSAKIKSINDAFQKVVILILVFCAFGLMRLSGLIQSNQRYINFLSNIHFISAKLSSVPLKSLETLDAERTLLSSKVEILKSEMLELQSSIKETRDYSATLGTIKTLLSSDKIHAGTTFVLAKIKYYKTDNAFQRRLFIEPDANHDFIFTSKLLNALVIANGGMIGHVIGFSKEKNLIEILPINDIQSRIPVYLPKSNIYGLAIGDGDGVYVARFSEDGSVKIINEDEVITSSENNLVTPNIPLGTVKSVNQNRVEITQNSNLSEKYVSILLPN